MAVTQGMGRRERKGGLEMSTFSRRARHSVSRTGRGTVKTAVTRRERRHIRRLLVAAVAW